MPNFRALLKTPGPGGDPHFPPLFSSGQPILNSLRVVVPHYEPIRSLFFFPSNASRSVHYTALLYSMTDRDGIFPGFQSNLYCTFRTAKDRHSPFKVQIKMLNEPHARRMPSRTFPQTLRASIVYPV